MQLLIDIDDKLAAQFLAITPKHEQQSALQAMIRQYVQDKKQRDNELDFIGMWADRTDTTDVDSYVSRMRQGRQFDVD